MVATRSKTAALVLLLCGCVSAVTITPLPYKGNEPGFRFPRGTATFLDQEEGNRIRRQMQAGQGRPGFYGGNEYDKENRRGVYDGYDRRDGYKNDRHDGYDRYDNEVDRDQFYDRQPKDYYPNYNPAANNRKGYECDRSPGIRGPSNWSGRDYNLRGSGYDDRWRGGSRRGGYEDRGGYEKNRGGFRDGEAWRGNYLGDNLGEGTVGFYGRTRRV